MSILIKAAFIISLNLLQSFFERKKNDINKKFLNLFKSSWYVYYLLFHLSLFVIVFPYTVNFLIHVFLNLFNITVSLFYHVVIFTCVNLTLVYLYDTVEKKRHV